MPRCPRQRRSARTQQRRWRQQRLRRAFDTHAATAEATANAFFLHHGIAQYQHPEHSFDTPVNLVRFYPAVALSMAGRPGAMRLGVLIAALPLTLGDLCGRNCCPPLRMSARRSCGFSWCAAKCSGLDLRPRPHPPLWCVQGFCRPCDASTRCCLQTGSVWTRAGCGEARAARSPVRKLPRTACC